MYPPYLKVQKETFHIAIGFKVTWHCSDFLHTWHSTRIFDQIGLKVPLLTDISHQHSFQSKISFFQLRQGPNSAKMSNLIMRSFQCSLPELVWNYQLAQDVFWLLLHIFLYKIPFLAIIFFSLWSSFQLKGISCLIQCLWMVLFSSFGTTCWQTRSSSWSLLHSDADIPGFRSSLHNGISNLSWKTVAFHLSKNGSYTFNDRFQFLLSLLHILAI